MHDGVVPDQPVHTDESRYVCSKPDWLLLEAAVHIRLVLLDNQEPDAFETKRAQRRRQLDDGRLVATVLLGVARKTARIHRCRVWECRVDGSAWPVCRCDCADQRRNGWIVVPVARVQGRVLCVCVSCAVVCVLCVCVLLSLLDVVEVDELRRAEIRELVATVLSWSTSSLAVATGVGAGDGCADGCVVCVSCAVVCVLCVCVLLSRVQGRVLCVCVSCAVVWCCVCVCCCRCWTLWKWTS